MQTMSEIEIDCVFGGTGRSRPESLQYQSPEPDIFRQAADAWGRGEYATAFGLLLDNPFTTIGNGIDQVVAGLRMLKDKHADDLAKALLIL